MNGLAIASLWRRDLVRFYRDRARVIGAIAPPVLFWLLLGWGLGDSLRLPGAPQGVSYLEYYFAGTLVLIVLFTSVFATISIIEDRREGFLQAVLASPVSRASLAAGKILGASTVGLLQGMIFLAFAGPAGLHAGPADYALAVLALALCSLGLTGLGFCIAWRLDSTQGFHGVMNLFLIPMWMLSGALFPAATAKPWLKAVMAANPVSYGVAALQHALAPAQAAQAGMPPLACCLAVLTAFAAGALIVSGLVARENAAG